jgi:hypothetical protein
MSIIVAESPVTMRANLLDGPAPPTPPLSAQAQNRIMIPVFENPHGASLRFHHPGKKLGDIDIETDLVILDISISFKLIKVMELGYWYSL